MINGVSLSEIESVNRTRLSHCRRVTQIEEGSFSRFSVQESELAKVYHKKKLNHERWRRYHQEKFTSDIEKNNQSQSRKLDKIRLGRSIYAVQTVATHLNQNSPSLSKGSSFYTRKRGMQQIESANSAIARKIINARGSLDQAKTNQQYSKYRETVHRLERFPFMQRMTSFSQKKSRLKTEGTTSHAFSPLSPLRKNCSLFKATKRYLFNT